MKNYVINYIKHNVRKCIIMLVMLSACSTLTFFTLDIITNLIKEINYSWRDDVSKEDLKSMVFLLQCGVGIIIGFCYLIVDNTYSVILRGREKEFTLLNNIGLYEKKIKKLLIGEAIAIGTLAVGVGILCSKILSFVFMKRFDLYEKHTIPNVIYIIVEVAVVLALIIIINKNLKNVSIGYNKPVSKSNHIQKKTVIKMTLYSVIGSILLILSLLDDVFFKLGLENNITIIQTVVFVLGIILALNGWLYWLLMLFRKVSISFKNTSLYLANEQCIYNFYKIRSVMNSIIFAVMLLVGFLGLFESVKGTTRNYVNESVNYDYMVIFDSLPEMPLEDIRHELNKLTNDDKYFALALTIKTLSKNDKVHIFTGIEEDYYRLQRLYVTEESNIKNIYDDNELKVLYSSKMASEKKIGIGDIILDYRYEGKVFEFRIGALYDPINLKQAFASRSSLSRNLYGVGDKYNTLYFEGFTSNEVDSILKQFSFKDYSKYDMSTVRNEAIEQSLNGTEMIEVLLYTSMFFVASLVVNIFVLSFTDRIKQYTEMILLGVQKSVLLLSMLIESAIIFLGGSLIGYILGIPFIKGALVFIESELVFETIIVVPFIRIFLIIMLSFISVLICTYYIGKSIFKGNILKYNYRE